METVMFVHGKLPTKSLQEWVKKDAQVVALDIASSALLESEGIRHKTANEYPVPDSNKRTVDFLNAWSCKPLMNGKNVKEIMEYEGFSLWWCMEYWLYYSFLYRDPLNKIIEAIDVVSTVLKSENPMTVVFIDDSTLFSRVIPLLAGKRTIKRIPCRRPIKETIKERIRPWGIRHFFKWHTFARNLIWKLERIRANYKPQKSEGKRILAVCSYNWKTVEHPSLPNPVIGDPYVTPIVEYLKDSTITYVDATQREYRGFSVLKQKARTNQRHILLEQYATLGTTIKVKNALRRFRNIARALEASPEFRKSWLYEGIDLWPLFAAQFRCYFDNRLEGHLIDVECAKLLLLREHPDLVIYPCEGGDLAYVFFKLCAGLKIPCIGIQHGTMSYSPLTVHAKEEICRGKPECLPRPTKLLVYGSYYRDFLVKNGHYPADEISIIGNLRYDYFVNAKRMSKSAMIEKYGLDRSRPIVLYAGNILPSQTEYEEMTRAVFRAAKELGVFLVVKQHPGETSDALYHRLANETGLKPFITKNASTLELIAACDLIIGAESTLDYEAMILDKPVIVVNLGNRQDLLPFVREGAALGVYKVEDVLPALRNALSDEKTKAHLAEGMKKLVEAHCYKIDGKAAERAAEIIRGLIK